MDLIRKQQHLLDVFIAVIWVVIPPSVPAFLLRYFPQKEFHSSRAAANRLSKNHYLK